MSKIIMTRGLPGAGKSTAVMSFMGYSGDFTVRLSRDEARATMFGITGVGTATQEALITKSHEESARLAIKEGLDVILDATNLNPQFVRPWGKLGVPVEFWDFPVSVEECIQRDANRERSVGQGVISRMAKRAKVHFNGTLPAPPKIRIAETFDFTPAPPRDDYKIDAIIVDIDGTLANHEGIRNPYDTSKYHEDTLHDDVARIVNTLAGTYHVLITSGRSEDFFEVTKTWLAQNMIDFDELIMRKSGDTRNDAIVKHDLFHEIIAPRYNVVMAFDDRDRVVRAWREMGIKTAQVAYGDF